MGGARRQGTKLAGVHGEPTTTTDREGVAVFERCGTADGKVFGDWSHAATRVIHSEAQHDGEKEVHRDVTVCRFSV